ncbi:hypothetical protein ACHQM5_026599 [Ranunculus cassubicifolius]
MNNLVEKVRGVNLGGWLVVEGWIKPSLFDEIPNGDMLDGTKVQFKSVTLQKYIVAENGGGSILSVDRSSASAWETFSLWRVSESEFQFRTNGGQFLSCDGEGSYVSAMANSPSTTETFYVERNANKVHIRLLSGTYLQATSSNQIIANYPGRPGWDDNMATFEMTIVSDLRGDYQLANGHGPIKAKEVLEAHRSSFIAENDFSFLSKNGINTVRIPVGWWIVLDPNTPAPFVGGGVEYLDKAFSWAQTYNIKCIIDLHAAPGSQNGFEHSSSRDGFMEWATPEHISQSLEVIDYLASRYAKHPALLGIELLNEPTASGVPLDVLVSYYSRGYQIVRRYSSTAYVIFCERLGSDPLELFQANIGSSNTVLDLHWYNLYSDSFKNMSVADNIEFIQNKRQTDIQRYNGANGPLIFIGEWVNEMEFQGATQSDYQNFGKAQLEAYNAGSFGWAYWSFKNVFQHWDLEWNIQNNHLLLGKYRFSSIYSFFIDTLEFISYPYPMQVILQTYKFGG